MSYIYIFTWYGNNAKIEASRMGKHQRCCTRRGQSFKVIKSVFKRFGISLAINALAQLQKRRMDERIVPWPTSGAFEGHVCTAINDYDWLFLYVFYMSLSRSSCVFAFFPCRLWHEFAMWCQHRSLEMLYHWVDHALGKLTSMQISVRWVEMHIFNMAHGSFMYLLLGSGVSNHRAIGTWSIASNFKVWRGRLVDIWGRAKGWTWSHVGRGAISVQ